MPIQGVTTQRRLPRLGKIRTGIKSANDKGQEYPKAVDYFVCPPEVQSVYGEQPKSLDIILPVDSEELIAPAYYKAYSMSRGLVCKGDGESANRLIDSARRSVEADTGVITGPIADREAQATEWVTGITCPGRDCLYYQPGRTKQCREVMNLQFLIPSVPGLGVWQLDTSSYHSIVNIYSGLELIRGMFGTVAMIPLQLSLEPMEVSPEGRKKTVHVLHLRSGLTLAEIAQTKRQALATSLVPAPDETREELLFPERGYENGQSHALPASESTTPVSDIGPTPPETASQEPDAGPTVPEAASPASDGDPDSPRFHTMGDFMRWAHGKHGKTTQDVLDLARRLYPDEEIAAISDVGRHKEDPRLIAALTRGEAS